MSAELRPALEWKSHGGNIFTGNNVFSHSNPLKIRVSMGS
jgi:hypothetical protein